MRILLVGAGGVGGAITGIAARRPFFDSMVVADYDEAKAQRAAERTGDDAVLARSRSMRPTKPRSAPPCASTTATCC